MQRILIVTGDAGEAYETLYAVHRMREAGYQPVVAALAARRLHLVMHDFEPGWDTYVERPGYGIDADISFNDVNPSDYTGILLIGGRAPALPAIEHRADASLFDIMEDCERRIIVDMLEKCGWNQTEAAERFHVPLSTLNQKIKRLAIELRKKNNHRESAGDRANGSSPSS